MDAHTVEPLATSTVELKDLEAWCNKPDMNKGNVSKLTSPFTGKADTTTQGQDHVTKILAAVEAFVGVAPYTVHGVNTLRLSEDILECDLKMVIDAVRITVDKIKISHFDSFRLSQVEIKKFTKLTG